jgi:drug/metabolite transporter (DMT)-like permease
MTRASAILLLVAAMCLTGSNVPIGKAVIADVPVYALMLVRFAVATAILAALAATEPGPRLRTMTVRQTLDLLLLSLLGSVGYMALSLEGVKRTSGVDAGIILATLPAVTALIGMLAGHGRPSRPQILAIGLAVAGLTLVNTAAAPHGNSSALGNALVGAAVLCEATFVLVAGRISAVFRPIRLSLGVSAASLILAVPLGLMELMALPFTLVPLSAWAGALWYALSASVLCTILWYRGAPHVETWLAGLATAALPISALALSTLLLGETISASRLVGAALVIAAIAIGAVSPRRVPTP